MIRRNNSPNTTVQPHTGLPKKAGLQLKIGGRCMLSLVLQFGAAAVPARNGQGVLSGPWSKSVLRKVGRRPVRPCARRSPRAENVLCIP